MPSIKVPSIKFGKGKPKEPKAQKPPRGPNRLKQLIDRRCAEIDMALSTQAWRVATLGVLAFVLTMYLSDFVGFEKFWSFDWFSAETARAVVPSLVLLFVLTFLGVYTASRNKRFQAWENWYEKVDNKEAAPEDIHLKSRSNKTFWLARILYGVIALPLLLNLVFSSSPVPALEPLIIGKEASAPYFLFAIFLGLMFLVMAINHGQYVLMGDRAKTSFRLALPKRLPTHKKVKAVKQPSERRRPLDADDYDEDVIDRQPEPVRQERVSTLPPTIVVPSQSAIRQDSDWRDDEEVVRRPEPVRQERVSTPPPPPAAASQSHSPADDVVAALLDVEEPEGEGVDEEDQRILQRFQLGNGRLDTDRLLS